MIASTAFMTQLTAFEPSHLSIPVARAVFRLRVTPLNQLAFPCRAPLQGINRAGYHPPPRPSWNKAQASSAVS